ncbi:MAG: hypothetical protein KatS3mg059_1235 [Thermomicrobiales bacterium]|nr:MAG: hypothetical protein KatS3mg059_1235 [Thermomicrobiales bacterium]
MTSFDGHYRALMHNSPPSLTTYVLVQFAHARFGRERSLRRADYEPDATAATQSPGMPQTC